jgi:phosphate starvation-inducible PhoH-like protein
LDLSSRNIELGGINAAAFFGVNNQNLKHLKSFFPKLSIVARGHKITVKGEEEIIDQFELKLSLLLRHFERFNSLSENNIDNLMLSDGEKMLHTDNGSETLVHGNGGVKIKARTVNQKKLVDSIQKNDMVFAIGPAGTGKTYTAVALAVKALKAKEVN